MTQNFRLAVPSARIPVPAHGMAEFPAGADGIPVNPADPFFARLIREGAIVPVPAKARTKSSKPARTPAGETTKGND